MAAGADEQFTAGIEHAALDSFRGYADALRDELPDAVAVLDAFHVVKLGTQVVDEVRRRVQQDTLDRGGHKHDPHYRIRGLRRRRDYLWDKQIARHEADTKAARELALTTVFPQRRAAQGSPDHPGGPYRCADDLDRVYPVSEHGLVGDLDPPSSRMGSSDTIETPSPLIRPPRTVRGAAPRPCLIRTR